MFNDNFTNHFNQILYPEGAPFFTPNGCTGDRLKKNLSHINAVFADWDFKPKVGEATGTGKPDFKQFMLDIDDLPTPTYIVESGNGWHLYWMLEESILVDDTNREEMIKQVEGMHRYINNNFGSDSGARDVLHLMRLPGHEHRKQREHPFMVKVISEEDTRYAFDELLTAMPPEYKEEVAVFESSDTEDYDIKQAAIDAWKQKGAVVSFDTIGRMIWNDQATGTFIGRSGNRNYIATTSEEFLYKGNPVTYVAGVLGISTKQAYLWLINKYGEPKSKVVVVAERVIVEERERYLEHLEAEHDEDWAKTKKHLEAEYIANFHKYFKLTYPTFLFEKNNESIFWDYNSETGIYDELELPQVKAFILKLLIDEGFVNKATDAIAKTILAKYRATNQNKGHAYDDFDTDVDMFHAKNGWLNLVTKEFIPHTSDRLSRRVSGVCYDTEATCPEFDKFMDEDSKLPKDAVRVIDQFSGYLLQKERPVKKMLIFEGRPGSGKSMVPEMWRGVLGEMSVQTSLSKLGGESSKFNNDMFSRATFCFIDEANPKTPDFNESFQSMITQPDYVIERKGIQNKITVENTLRFVLCLNEMPDRMPPGMDRRYRHILFPRSFRDEGIEDEAIYSRIKKNELSGVLNRMLRGYDDFNKMGILTSIQGEEERKGDYLLASDDFSAFLNEHFLPVSEDEVRYVGKYKILRDAFQAEFPKPYNNSLSVQSFNKKLFSNRLSAFSRVKKARDREGWGYSGLRLKEGHDFPEYANNPMVVKGEIVF